MLSELLAVDVYVLFMIFTRIGAAVMFLPGFLNANYYARARLMLALSVAYVLMPVLGPKIPPMPASIAEFGLLVMGEVLVGAFFGLVLQAILAALDLTGNILSFSVGLAAAMVSDPSTQQQSQILSSFLTFTGVVVIFLTNTHHLMIRGVVESYALFIPGQPLPLDDLVSVFIRMLSDGFRLGMAIVAPLLVFALLFNAALGFTNRLVPQMQVFFVGMPLQIIIGLFLLAACLPAMMYWFLIQFADQVTFVFSRG